jgi:hypothetical protein
MAKGRCNGSTLLLTTNARVTIGLALVTSMVEGISAKFNYLPIELGNLVIVDNCSFLTLSNLRHF